MKKILYYFAFCLSLASFVACEDSSSASDEITSSDSSSSVFDRMSSDHEPKSSSASDEIASSVSSSSAADEMGFDHEPDESGKIYFDEDNPALGFVYEDSAWRKATSLEISLGLGCVESTNGLYVGTSFADYVCDVVVEHSWKQARVMEIDKKSLLSTKNLA